MGHLTHLESHPAMPLYANLSAGISVMERYKIILGARKQKPMYFMLLAHYNMVGFTSFSRHVDWGTQPMRPMPSVSKKAVAHGL